MLFSVVCFVGREILMEQNLTNSIVDQAVEYILHQPDGESTIVFHEAD